MKQRFLDIEQQSFQREIMLHSYRSALRFNQTWPLKKKFINNAKSQLNSIISVYGKTGSGKSIIAWVMGDWNAQAYGTEMNADCVHFSDYDLLMSLEDSQPGDFHIKDEQVYVYGEGSLQIQSSLQNIEMTVREGEVSLVYCSPELRLHTHHYILRPALKLWELPNPKYKEDYRVLSWVFDGLKKEGNRPIGYVVTGLPKGSEIDKSAKHHRDRIIWPSEFLRYKQKKTQFIKSAKTGQLSSGSSEIIEDIADRFIEEYDGIEDIESKKELKAILKMDKRFKRNLTTSQEDSLVEMIKIKCKMEGIPCLKR